MLKLVQGLCMRRDCEDEFLKYLDLAALATIADVVPLLDENRIIASLGLKRMETTENEGLAALIRTAGLAGKSVTSYGAAFALAPRVNAAGRLGSAARGIRLFTADSKVMAEALAKELDDENRCRQETENRIIEEAVAFVEEKLDPVREKVLVVSGEGWHHGVIGIVASKILEKYNRPTIVISVENGIGKGSGRSLKCLNLFLALSHCEDLMERFGGHEMAAGLTIPAENIDVFRAKINAYADSLLTDADLLPCIKVDAFLEKEDIHMESVKELERMAPFGAGNPGAVFGYMALCVAEIRQMSDGRHLKLLLKDGSMSVEAVGFNMGELAGAYEAGDAVDAVFSLEVNRWNGSERLQWNLREFKPCIYAEIDKNIVFNQANDYNKYELCEKELDRLRGHYNLRMAELVPGRPELEAVFRYLRACRAITSDLFLLSALISEKFHVRMNYFKLRRCFEIFEELGLMTTAAAGAKSLAVQLTRGGQKVELENSWNFRELQRLLSYDS